MTDKAAVYAFDIGMIEDDEGNRCIVLDFGPNIPVEALERIAGQITVVGNDTFEADLEGEQEYFTPAVNFDKGDN